MSQAACVSVVMDVMRVFVPHCACAGQVGVRADQLMSAEVLAVAI
jgi:hypothetical protein